MSLIRKAQPLFILITTLVMASSAQAQWMPWDGWTPRGQPLPWDGWWYQQGQQPYYYVPPVNGLGNGQAPTTGQGQFLGQSPLPTPEVPAPMSCDDSEQLQQLKADSEQLKATHAATIKRLEAQSLAQIQAQAQAQTQTQAQARIDALQTQLATANTQISRLKKAAVKHQEAAKHAKEPLKAAKREISRLKQEGGNATIKIAELEALTKRTKGQLRAATAARGQCVQEAESERELATQRLSKLQTQAKQCAGLAAESASLKRRLQDQLQDSDGDGVINAADRCPASAKGAQVATNGCEADDDADGVSNRLDVCADSKPRSRVAADGCDVGQAIALPDVQFVSGSAQLLPAAKTALDAVAEKLSKLPVFRAEVAGHTDSVGDAAFNLRLSKARAQTVRDYLIGRGVATEQLSAKGYGETQAIADNKTRAGRTKNRRVELRRSVISE